jgi:hypothetical protein
MRYSGPAGNSARGIILTIGTVVVIVAVLVIAYLLLFA